MTEYFYTATYSLSSYGQPKPIGENKEGFTSGVFASESETAKGAFEELKQQLTASLQAYPRIKSFWRV